MLAYLSSYVTQPFNDASIGSHNLSQIASKSLWPPDSLQRPVQTMTGRLALIIIITKRT
jgi:hypothetical protein